MTKRMLIDAAHPEETRVVIVDGTRVEELDFESRNKRQLRGNVYLAKVTRVEPSLQAAFIDYGGNRHGFLAFSEIHPDYYQLPKADRDALQAEQEAELAATEAEDLDEDEEDENLDPDSDDVSDENDAEIAEEQKTVSKARRRSRSKRRYKIQEVIKRGQILLVQAVKEERGNKGAAMTTYLSLAGRYCVLMPNTPRGGGISRKIASSGDRNRLKKIMADLDVPSGVGVIVRTAGAKRTKAEITRDYAYLSKLWGTIRSTTLESIAPALIHEEGDLVKRSIRDLYNKDIAEVLVQGPDAYRSAKDFIKMLMPSHAKFVKKYDDPIPLFLRYNVERQIESSLDSEVKLKSGGYLVIHPTEALVSVDVNSGKSTKERNVERTALKTNLEAAEEVARQMRLRDLAGLIVIDFIDMDENRNNRAVEKKMKDVLGRDRARIQTSRISQFGLMEISRQRRRRSLLEGSTTSCPHCDGVGRQRTVESTALALLRSLEEFAVRGRAKKIRVKCPPDVAAYLLNDKAEMLESIDSDHDVTTIIERDEKLFRPHFTMEASEKRSDGRKDPLVKIEKEIEAERKEAEKERQREAAEAKAKAKSKPRDSEEDDEEEEDAETTTRDRDEDSESKPRRRRGRRGGRNRKRKSSEETEANESDDAETSETDEADEEQPKPKRRSRSRSRRRASSKDGDTASDESETATADEDETEEEDAPKRSRARRRAPSRGDDGKSSSRRRKAPSRDGSDEEADTPSKDESDDDAPKSRRRRKAPSRDGDDAEAKPARKRRAPAKVKAEETEDEDAPKPARRRKAPAKSKATDVAEAKPARKRRAPAKAKVEDVEDDAPKPARRRKAPAKAAVEDEVEAKPARKRRAPAKAKSDDTEDAPKPARRRKAPAKAKAESAEDKPDAKPARKRRAPAKSNATEAEDDAPKPARRRKAPAKAKADDADDAPKPARHRKAPAEASDADDAPKPSRKRAAPTKAKAEPADEAPAKPARRRAAPKKPAAPAKAEAAPAPDPAPEVKSAAEPARPADTRRRAAPPRKKRGLLDRLMGKGADD